MFIFVFVIVLFDPQHSCTPLLLSRMMFRSPCSARVALVSVTTDVWTHIGPNRERTENISLTWQQSTVQSETMSGVPATTVFGAGDLQGLVSQLNLWTPQVELTL